ncbi:MAG: hypothetical protein ACFBSG_05095 [Leptolyngbyaceae cyanobacterium]
MNHKLVYALPSVIAISALVGLSNVDATAPWKLTPSAAVAQAADEMTIEHMAAILLDVGENVQGKAGQWQLTLAGQPAIAIADTENDRMRIVVPITAADSLSVEQVEAMLVANYHLALDARYAVTNGRVVAVYVHPLRSLQAADLRSALSQVSTLAANFGTTYSSGELGFGPTDETPTKAPQVVEETLDL